jgi:amidohydrolase
MRLILLLLSATVVAIGAPIERIDELAQEIEAKVIAWRHHIHENPELSNQEVMTAGYVAEHLRGLGIEVHTGVAGHGVVGLLRGGTPGPVIALRADMDALPVTEQTGLPYASKVKVEYGGKEIGVMHACGHDAHVAILMGAAEVLAGVRDDLAGTVKFIFNRRRRAPGPHLSGALNL